jgi:hypothetical protein
MDQVRIGQWFGFLGHQHIAEMPKNGIQLAARHEISL